MPYFFLNNFIKDFIHRRTQVFLYHVYFILFFARLISSLYKVSMFGLFMLESYIVGSWITSTTPEYLYVNRQKGIICFSNIVFISNLLVYSLNKDKKDIHWRRSYFLFKCETLKECSAAFVLFSNETNSIFRNLTRICMRHFRKLIQFN